MKDILNTYSQEVISGIYRKNSYKSIGKTTELKIPKIVGKWTIVKRPTKYLCISTRIPYISKTECTKCC